MRITRVTPSLLDPRLRTNLEPAWTSSCTIQTILTTLSASDQEVPSGAADIVGMQEIPARIGPLVRTRPTDDIQRGTTVQEFHARRHLLLNGYFPAIVADGSMQAVVDGTVFPIRGVDYDGNHFITRLKLEVVLPNG